MRTRQVLAVYSQHCLRRTTEMHRGSAFLLSVHDASKCMLSRFIWAEHCCLQREHYPRAWRTGALHPPYTANTRPTLDRPHPETRTYACSVIFSSLLLLPAHSVAAAHVLQWSISCSSVVLAAATQWTRHSSHPAVCYIEGLRRRHCE